MREHLHNTTGATVNFTSIKPEENLLADRINAVLPQTQCKKCGYDGCRPYAMAIANREADINRCPPGGEDGIRELACLLGVEFKPFDKDIVPTPPSVAFIDEPLCIGCTLCLQACPVDAISGAPKQMHTIMASLCTGCELCIEPCPVNCISMLPLQQTTGSELSAREKRHAAARTARERYQFKIERIERDKREKAEKLANKEKAAAKNMAQTTDAQALIQAALERARAQTATVKPKNTEELTHAQQAQIDEIEARRSKINESAHPDSTPPIK